MTKNALPIRSALETLRLEFPDYRIDQRVIGGTLFYLADAISHDVQPRFAQAETVDRLRAKLRVPEAGFSAEVPSIARVYDVLLGGKNNFDGGPQQAEQVLEVYPHAAELAVQARQFQARAVTYVAEHGHPAVPRRRLRAADRAEHSRDRAGGRGPTPGSSTSITTPRCCRTPGTCWPRPPVCWPWPGT